jgi:mono/diheme cytochrome c family protein
LEDQIVTTRDTHLLRFRSLGARLGLTPLGGVLTLAFLASGCGTVSDTSDGAGPSAKDTPAPVEVPVQRETCADNPLLAGCPATATAAPAPATPDPGVGGDAAALAKAAAENVLASNCGQCHGPALTPEQARAGMNYINDIDKLVSTGKVIPLDSKDSLIIQRMEKGEMPPPASGLPTVTEADINTVASYIDNPVFWSEYQAKPVCKITAFADFDQVYKTVSADVITSDQNDAQFFRYISLTNRAQAGCDDTQLTQQRDAVTKMMNMLSGKAGISTLTAIDPNSTIFRVDLRDFKWNRNVQANGRNFNDGWEAVIDSNPYAVEFSGRDADIIKQLTGTRVPIMFGDQMLHAATVGDVYYALIGIDSNGRLSDFIDSLGIDVQSDIENGDAVRAGTTKSRVSRQDRVLERHDMGNRSGVFWQAFDFEANQSNQSIFQDPFGFSPGGTEAIFTLPNGMLGYVIADQNDRIVNESDILLDTSLNDFKAITSVSCSNCHALGFIPTVDEVRDFVTTNARSIGISKDQIDQVKQIYLDPTDFAAQISDDSKGFYQAALVRAGLPTTGADPVAATFIGFEGRVDLDTAAADLGLQSQDLSDNLGLVDPVLAVLKDGAGTLDRDDFTAVYVATLCRLTTLNQNAPDQNVCDQAPVNGRLGR